MNRTPVQSSNIQSIGYDESKRILEVEFNDDSVYHYFEVPKSEYEGIMAASSHGKYLAQNVKGHYEYERL